MAQVGPQQRRQPVVRVPLDPQIQPQLGLVHAVGADTTVREGFEDQELLRVSMVYAVREVSLLRFGEAPLLHPHHHVLEVNSLRGKAQPLGFCQVPAGDFVVLQTAGGPAQEKVCFGMVGRESATRLKMFESFREIHIAQGLVCLLPMGGEDPRPIAEVIAAGAKRQQPAEQDHTGEEWPLTDLAVRPPPPAAPPARRRRLRRSVNDSLYAHAPRHDLQVPFCNSRS